MADPKTKAPSATLADQLTQGKPSGTAPQTDRAEQGTDLVGETAAKLATALAEQRKAIADLAAAEAVIFSLKEKVEVAKRTVAACKHDLDTVIADAGK